MSFKAYTITPGPSDAWCFSRPEPVRFSGPRGLVSRRLSAQLPAGSARWSATDEDWLLMLEPGAAGKRWIVFEQTETETLRVSRLTAIHGCAHGGRTELLLHFSPLKVVQSTPSLVAVVPATARAWSEGLTLDGATDRPGSSWLWCERELNIGAAVLGR